MERRPRHPEQLLKPPQALEWKMGISPVIHAAPCLGLHPVIQRYVPMIMVSVRPRALPVIHNVLNALGGEIGVEGWEVPGQVNMIHGPCW